MADIKRQSFKELANFQPKQFEAFQEMIKPECKYFLYGGAAGGGKSYFLRWTALYLAMYYFKKHKIKNVNVGLFSKDYPTLKDRQIARIKREFPDYLGDLKDFQDEGYSFKLAPEYGGGFILLRNLDDPSKYKSTEFAAELVEELTENKEEVFEDLRFRLRWPNLKEVKFIGATNPTGIGHAWVKDKWINKDPHKTDRERDRFSFVPAFPQDNRFIDENYIEGLKSLPENKKKALLEGSWDTFEGQVFQEFSRGLHVMAPIVPSPSFPHFLSFDWGYSDKSAFAAYAHALVPTKVDGIDFNRIITYQEWYGSLKSPQEWAEQIYKQAATKKFVRGYCDPAMMNTGTDGSTSISKLMQKKWKQLHGYNWLTMRKGNNNRINRVATVHNWLKMAPDNIPYWVITSNCQNLIRTLPELVYDENNPDDVDTTQEDHAYDSAGYFMVMQKFVDADPGGYHTYRTREIFKPFNKKGEAVGLDLDKFKQEVARKRTSIKYF